MRVSRIALGALMVTMAACAPELPVAVQIPQPLVAPGVFELATVDGKPLPYRVAETPALSADLVEESLTLFPDNTYRLQRVTYILPGATTDTISRSGTYFAVSKDIALLESGGAVSTYSVVDGGMELDGDAPPTSTPEFPIPRAVFLRR